MAKKHNIQEKTESPLNMSLQMKKKTNYNEENIEITQQSSKCRCVDRDETNNHIISEGMKLAQKVQDFAWLWGKVIYWEQCK